MMVFARMNLSAKSLLLVAFWALGCSADKDATTRRLDELQAEISRLKASQMAVQDRLEAVESRPSGPAPVTEALVDDDRPDLTVVKVDPAAVESEPVAPEADPNAERPSIVGDRKGVEVEAEARRR